MRTENNSTVTLVAAQSNLIAEQRTAVKRLVFEMSNNEPVGGNDVFVSVTAEAAANKGRRCQPGQTITWSSDKGYEVPQTRINAYSAAGTPILSIYEELEQRD